MFGVISVLFILFAAECIAFNRFLSLPRSNMILSAKKTYKVTVQHGGKDTVLDVREDTPILMAALDAGIDLPHDCDLGVCLTCPSKIVSGIVDQTGGTLDETVQEKVTIYLT
jgi:ferredoxin